jgi:hypothetical protein
MITLGLVDKGFVNVTVTCISPGTPVKKPMMVPPLSVELSARERLEDSFSESQRERVEV